MKITDYINSNQFEQCNSAIKSFVTEATIDYSERLHRYSRTVVDKKKDDLRSHFSVIIDGIFRNFCNAIQEKALAIFEHDLRSSSAEFSFTKAQSALDRSVVFYRASIQGKSLYTCKPYLNNGIVVIRFYIP